MANLIRSSHAREESAKEEEHENQQAEGEQQHVDEEEDEATHDHLAAAHVEELAPHDNVCADNAGQKDEQRDHGDAQAGERDSDQSCCECDDERENADVKRLVRR